MLQIKKKLYKIKSMIIDNATELEAVCRRFATYPYVTIDTEFIREKTFYPDLCLVQIASRDEAFCIDPLAPEMNLQALFELLQNKNVVKVFHAARQDIEILFHLSGQIPTPIFDTQIGAMVCGFGENIGYQQVVQSILGVSLDKSMRCTNWAKRPLTDAQIQYALYDVTYLCDVYENMLAQLQENGRMSWIQSEMDTLCDKETYEPSSEHLLAHIRCSITKAMPLHIYRQLYLWRENLARQKNRPRRFLLKDDLLQELALLRPSTPEQMKNLRGISNNFEKSAMATEILDIIRTAMHDDIKNIKLPKAEKPLSATEKTLSDVLKLLLNIIATQEKVAPSLIASSEDINRFVRQNDVAFKHGWRYDFFGCKAEQLCHGALSIQYNPKTRQIELKQLETN